MRSAIVALLVSASFLLAGCSGKGGKDDGHTYACPDGTELDLEQFPDHENSTFNPLSKCPKKGGSATNSTSLAPNKMPVLSLKVSDDGGNETNVTLLMGNLTFDATGSSDPDGTITGIAVSVTDSNTTRTASLYDPATKTFKPATFRFDRPGVVNVTVAMVDDRAGFTVNQTHAYVNHMQVLNPQSIALPGGGPFATCDVATEPITGAAYFKQYSFALGSGASFVEASATTSGQVQGASAILTICNPAKEPVSDSGNPVTSNAPLPPPTGIESYFVGATLDADGEPNTSVAVTVVVHYEPAAA